MKFHQYHAGGVAGAVDDLIDSFSLKDDSKSDGDAVTFHKPSRSPMDIRTSGPVVENDDVSQILAAGPAGKEFD